LHTCKVAHIKNFYNTTILKRSYKDEDDEEGCIFIRVDFCDVAVVADRDGR
jgi:hypothetical protein